MPDLRLTASPRRFHVLIKTRSTVRLIIQQLPESFAKGEFTSWKALREPILRSSAVHVLSYLGADREERLGHVSHTCDLPWHGKYLGHAVGLVSVLAFLFADPDGGHQSH
ncbi:hypothetical protein KC363_g207 [Hortaea werneckii]|nr:hypothetical protein KC363_g207 [Hortaea werneckii]